MAVELNHTIVMVRDKRKSAEFLTSVLGLPEPAEFGPFTMVQPANNVTLDLMETDDEISVQHYAFKVSEQEFDEIFGRVRERGLRYWADPGHQRPGEINTRDGGRGVYFDDPDGHALEILTRDYGSGG